MRTRADAARYASEKLADRFTPSSSVVQVMTALDHLAKRMIGMGT